MLEYAVITNCKLVRSFCPSGCSASYWCMRSTLQKFTTVSHSVLMQTLLEGHNISIINGCERSSHISLTF